MRLKGLIQLERRAEQHSVRHGRAHRVVGVALISCLSLLQNARNSPLALSPGILAIPVAEAGVEEPWRT